MKDFNLERVVPNIAPSPVFSWLLFAARRNCRLFPAGTKEDQSSLSG